MLVAIVYRYTHIYIKDTYVVKIVYEDYTGLMFKRLSGDSLQASAGCMFVVNLI